MKSVRRSTLIIILTLSIIFIMVSCKKENNAPTDNTVADSSFTVNGYTLVPLTTDLRAGFRNFYFISLQKGFCLSDSGEICRTTDGCSHWEILDSPTRLPLYAVYFVDENTGYIVGGKSSCGGTGCTVPGSIVLKTADGGNSWTIQSIPYEWSELHSVYFLTSQKGFAVGLGLCIKTTNGGNTWERFSIGTNGSLFKICFVNQNTGFIAGLTGLYRTSDGGTTWNKIQTPSTTQLYDLFFVNETVGYCGGAPNLMKTIDAGLTWVSLNNSATDYSQIYFADENQGFTIGQGHYTGGDFGYYTAMLTETADGGITWVRYDNITFNSVFFPVKNNGYAFYLNKIFKMSYNLAVNTESSVRTSE